MNDATGDALERAKALDRGVVIFSIGGGWKAIVSNERELSDGSVDGSSQAGEGDSPLAAITDALQKLDPPPTTEGT